MHGLILNLSLPFWQVQPGSYVLQRRSDRQPPSDPRFNRISLLYNLSQKVFSAGGFLPARAIQPPHSTQTPARARRAPGSARRSPPAQLPQVAPAEKATQGPGFSLLRPQRGPFSRRRRRCSALPGAPRPGQLALPRVTFPIQGVESIVLLQNSRCTARSPAGTRFPAGRGLPLAFCARQNFPRESSCALSQLIWPRGGHRKVPVPASLVNFDPLLRQENRGLPNLTRVSRFRARFFLPGFVSARKKTVFRAREFLRQGKSCFFMGEVVLAGVALAKSAKKVHFHGEGLSGERV
ncbi:Hypothetical_protein [Hexamita inflata]|uniref:Hypothetical_protein n=1 Tax=Hexamita inflata TaxID=28002 RepID=A0AA86NZU6_9EUKA|nr:Hypothetical protein HINF_LOCUS16819 [Hexamita inflata]